MSEQMRAVALLLINSFLSSSLFDLSPFIETLVFVFKQAPKMVQKSRFSKSAFMRLFIYTHTNTSLILLYSTAAL